MTDESTKPKSQRPKRDKVVKVKLLPTEYLQAQKTALNAGYPLATFARHSLLNQRVYDKPQRKINHQFMIQILRIGNNANQIAKAVNTLKAQNELEKLELAELNLKLDELTQELKLLRELAGGN